METKWEWGFGVEHEFLPIGTSSPQFIKETNELTPRKSRKQARYPYIHTHAYQEAINNFLLLHSHNLQMRGFYEALKFGFEHHLLHDNSVRYVIQQSSFHNLSFSLESLPKDPYTLFYIALIIHRTVFSFLQFKIYYQIHQYTGIQTFSLSPNTFFESLPFSKLKQQELFLLHQIFNTIHGPKKLKQTFNSKSLHIYLLEFVPKVKQIYSAYTSFMKRKWYTSFLDRVVSVSGYEKRVRSIQYLYDGYSFTSIGKYNRYMEDEVSQHSIFRIGTIPKVLVNFYVSDVQHHSGKEQLYILKASMKKSFDKFVSMNRVVKLYHLPVPSREAKENLANVTFTKAQIDLIEYATLEFELPETEYFISGKDEYIPGVEFKSLHYRNQSVQQIHKQLSDIEEIYFHVLNHVVPLSKLAQLAKPFHTPPYGHLHNLIQLQDNISPKYINQSYTGSYHVWITIPYHPKDTPNDFLCTHIHFANLFQLVEPLFLCLLDTGSVCIGEPVCNRLSARMRINNFADIGSSDINRLNPTKEWTNFKYAKSITDLQNGIYHTSQIPHVILNENKEPTPNYQGLDSRGHSSPLFSNLLTNQQTYIPLPSSGEVPPNYYELLNKVAPDIDFRHKRQVGADIRTNAWELNFRPGLREGWDAVAVLMENSYLQWHYIRWDELEQKPSHITTVPPYDYIQFERRNMSKRIGMELRIFDHFPTPIMKDVLHAIACIASVAKETAPKKSKQIHPYSQTSWYQKQVAECFLHGSHTKFSQEYREALAKAFRFPGLRDTSADVSQFAPKFFQHIYRIAQKSPVYHVLTGDEELPMPNIVNINQEHWGTIFVEQVMRLQAVKDKYAKWQKNKSHTRDEFLRIFGKDWENDWPFFQMYEQTTGN